MLVRLSMSAPLVPEIDLGDARVARGVGALALEYLLAVVEHDDAVDDAHQHAHDVLDPDDRPTEPLADVAEHDGGALHLRRIEAAEAFIGEQQLGLRRQRAGKLELLERGGAEAVGANHGITGQADLVERDGGAALRLAARDTATGAVERRERDVVEQRQLAERARDLERARQPAPAHDMRRLARDLGAGEDDRAAARPQRAGDQVEDRALARAVGADEPEDLALPHLARHLVDRHEAAEALRQSLDREHLVFRRERKAMTSATASPARPS